MTVIADEIHCELVFPENVYTPFASLSEKFQKYSVTCVSPSKAFNIAGLQIANIVCADEYMRHKIDKAININEVCDVNPLRYATIAAYNEVRSGWRSCVVICLKTTNTMKDYCEKYLPDFPIAELEGTYLVWMD